MHHGGIGTTAQAIATGIFARVANLSIGAKLKPKKFTGQSLTENIHTLLSSPDVLERYRTFASKIDPAKALDAACDQIEVFALAQSKAEV